MIECGIALNTPSVKSDFPICNHPGLPTHLENFDYEMLKVLAIIFAKVADGTEIRLFIRSKVAKSDVTFEESVDLSGVTDALSVGEDVDFEQHNWMKLLTSPVFVGFLWIEWLQPVLLVKVVDSPGDELFIVVIFDTLREVL